VGCGSCELADLRDPVLVIMMRGRSCLKPLGIIYLSCVVFDLTSVYIIEECVDCDITPESILEGSAESLMRTRVRYEVYHYFHCSIMCTVCGGYEVYDEKMKCANEEVGMVGPCNENKKDMSNYHFSRNSTAFGIFLAPEVHKVEFGVQNAGLRGLEVLALVWVTFHFGN
jgi:hypothetical protein